ncbi:MAG: exodeoxyribonuclease VII large subunit [Nitrospirae bacterium]|nr:exodeoxyribonuclease VII large subunit [Nitrospirota bacterium]
MNYLTLKELTTIIKSTISAISDEYWVVAEIAELRCNVNSGHCYLDLVEKEEDRIVANIKGTIWRKTYQSISANFLESTGTELRAGIKILMLGKVSYHEVYGLSFNIREIDPAYTLGEMALKRKEIIARLTKEGIIDNNRQLSMPLVPQRIAIISSQTAAGYGDFLHKFESNPYGYKFRTKLFQAYVQGEQAEESILAALRKCKSQIDDFDLVVIIRGGGSQVDIHCFDSYQLAREIALFPIPVLTGIGHERDETVVDRVAHKRLITPTAVADFIIQKVRAFEESIDDLTMRLLRLTESVVNSEKHNINALAERLVSRSIQYLKNRKADLNASVQRIHTNTILAVRMPSLRMKEYEQKIKIHSLHILNRANEALKAVEEKVRILSPENILKRGYSITLHNGKPIKDTLSLEAGDIIDTILYHGKIQSRVERLNNDNS